MDSLIFELQIVFYFQLFLSPNVRHRERARASAEREKEKHPTPLRWRSILVIRARRRTHLPYLRVHNSLCDNYKKQSKTSTSTPSWVTDLVMRKRSVQTPPPSPQKKRVQGN